VIHIGSALRELQAMHGLASIMIEGGLQVMEHTIKQHSVDTIIDTVVITVSPKVIGGHRLHGVKYSLGAGTASFALGEDFVIRSSTLSVEAPTLIGSGAAAPLRLRSSKVSKL
jgi:riboflavin biosynthesis pyrimidine reductase